jgi:hypothetical protein
VSAESTSRRPRARAGGPDVIHVDDCADAGATAIYAIADDNELFRYDPLPNAVTSITSPS